MKAMFRQAAPARIAALEAGRGSVMANAPDAVVSVRRIAHSLRGSGGTFGFPEITEAAKCLEESAEADVLEGIDGLLATLRKVASDDKAPVVALLLIEGDPAMAGRLKEKLASPGRDWVVAPTAAEAERVLERREFALVLLALQLPDADGRNLLLRLRERPRVNAVPILVFADRADPRVRAECLALGADDFIEAPREGDLLSMAVSARLQRVAEMTRGLRIDPLTGLPNRTALREAFERTASMARRIRFPLALALIDIDYFKTVNDTYGHATGDDVLRRTGATIANTLRTTDVVARWGGDEFAALFVNANIEGATCALDRMRGALNATRFKAPDGPAFPITVTAGLTRPADGASLEDAVAQADRLLYLGKQAGRNRVIAESDAEHPIKPKILVVEDDVMMASLIRALLETAGFEVVHFLDGIAALAASPKLNPALVILDRKMPGMDGLNLIGQLRRQAAFTRVPIVMLTALGGEADVVQGFERGADDYIVKPFSPPELVARVNRLVKAR